MQKLHTFPAGYPLFELRQKDGSRGIMKGIPWPVNIYYDPPYEPLHVHKTTIDTNTGLTMQFRGTICGAPAIISADSMASHIFINSRFVHAKGIKCQPHHRVVELAGGQHTISHQSCKVKLRLKGSQPGESYTQHITSYVVDLGTDHDMILGDNWLTQNQVELSFKHQCMRLGQGGGVMTIPIISNTTDDRSWAERNKPISLKKAIALRNKGAKLFIVNVVDNNITPMAMNTNDDYDHPISSSTDPLIDKVDFPSHISTKLQQVLERYQRLFLKRRTFPKDQQIGTVIDLEPGTKPPYRPCYRLSPAELLEVEKHIKEMLILGLIEPSNSPYGAPMLFVNKPDGSLRAVIDYRLLNSKTIKQKLHMPLISQLLDQLHGAKVFTGLDLQSGYWQLPLSPEDIPKTQFLTPLGSYSYKVLPQGLCNAPSVFQRLMNKLFREHLGKFVLIYLDDIIIYSKNVDEHAAHMETVLQILNEADLYISFKKCDFEKPELKFLGHIVGQEGIKVDPSKTKVIKDWPTPKSVTEVRSFCGLMNYFRKFIQGYSSMMTPLTNLTKQNVTFQWTTECEQAFQLAKEALLSAPVLAMPDFSQPFEIEVICDASIQGIGAVLTQFGRPIAFESRKLTPTERNWTTSDQELWAVIHALKTWRCYLEGVQFKVVTDHNPNTHLQTQPNLSRRQARWAEYLQRFHFTWTYRPGRGNVADPLSRHPDFSLKKLVLNMTTTRSRSKTTPETTTATHSNKRSHHDIAHEPVIDVTIVDNTEIPANPLDKQTITGTSAGDIYTLIQNSYDADPWFTDQNNLKSLTMRHGMWYHGNRLVIPDVHNIRTRILYELHDTPYSGHGGMTKTYRALLSMFWWPNMKHQTSEYIRTCATCQRNKSTNRKPGGLLQPLPIPDNPWDSIGMDFITLLPRTRDGYDAILVFVDRLTKMCHLIKCRTDIDAEGTAQLFVDHVWKLHGVPLHVVSDRGSVFVGKFMTEVFRLIGTKHNRSTAFHPQTNGLTEGVNRILEDMLRHYIGELSHNEWDTCLSTAEFAINNSYHESIGTTPFRLNFGKDPRLPLSIPDLTTSKVPSAAQFADRMQEGLISAKKCLTSAQQRQKRQYDKSHREVSFNEGDQVLLSTKHINMRTPIGTRTTKKLLPKWIGPFPIEKKIGAVAYKLTLPQKMRVHPVFHVSLLKQYLSDGRVQPPGPLFLDEDGEAYYQIDRILDHRSRKIGRRTYREYLVKWMDYGAEHNTWEPESSLEGSENGQTLLRYYDYVGLEPPVSLIKQPS